MSVARLSLSATLFHFGNLFHPWLTPYLRRTGRYAMLLHLRANLNLDAFWRQAPVTARGLNCILPFIPSGSAPRAALSVLVTHYILSRKSFNSILRSKGKGKDTKEKRYARDTNAPEMQATEISGRGKLRGGRKGTCGFTLTVECGRASGAAPFPQPAIHCTAAATNCSIICFISGARFRNLTP